MGFGFIHFLYRCYSERVLDLLLGRGETWAYVERNVDGNGRTNHLHVTTDNARIVYPQFLSILL